MDALQGGSVQYMHFDMLIGLELLYICIYHCILKFMKEKKLKLKYYLALPMLFLKGGKGMDHLENPSQHMETAPVLVTAVPTKSRSHHRTHSALIHLLPRRGRYLPTCLA